MRIARDLPAVGPAVTAAGGSAGNLKGRAGPLWTKVRWAILLMAFLCLRAYAQGGSVVVLSAQADEGTEEKEMAPPLIGMEAYRQVLASGRYVLGPGDEFLIYVAGMEEPLFSKVLAEGGLFVPSVGSVPVAGLSLREARDAIQKAFRQVVKQGEITAELNKLRNFPVTVVGVVSDPGVVTASGIERISEVIRKAGGLGSKASQRSIRVVKTGELDAGEWERVRAMDNPYDYLGLAEISHRVDLDQYGVTGNSQFNPFVEDGDLVIVPPQTGRVGVMGTVQRTGFFEFVEGDRLSDLLTLAQGLAPGYDSDNVMLFRYGRDRQTMGAIPVDIEGVLTGDEHADLLLQAGDWLVVREVPGFNQNSTVRIIGEVVYPGFYVVDKNRTSLREIIERAGGFTEDASLPEARVVREQMRGGTTDGEGEGEREVQDPEFERIRTIPVADRTKIENQYFIMKSREKKGHMVVDFVTLFREGDETQNITLMPGDIIFVPATPRTVMVSGQAAYPGAVVYDSTYTVWDYIEKSGGLSWRASKDIMVIKARTGEVKRIKEVAQVEPGDRIWIKEKPERDYWAIFTGTMAVIGQVSTVVLLYATLTQ